MATTLGTAGAAELTYSVSQEQLDQVAAQLPPRYRDPVGIGCGGFSVVVRAYDQLLRRHVAIKCYTAETSDAEKRRARSQHEHFITAGLRHPGIVPVHDRDPNEPCRWFAMAKVEGHTLAVHIQRTWSTPQPSQQGIEALVRLVTDAAAVVAFAHDNGVIHLDLKPENIMGAQRVYVLDWGLARQLDATVEDEPQDIAGTVPYMSPEQAHGLHRQFGPPSDVFSLGCVLFEVLTGLPPYRGHKSRLLMKARQAKVPAIKHTPGYPDITPSLAEIVARATAREPEARYADAGALSAALRNWFEAHRRRDEAEQLVSSALHLQQHIQELDDEIRLARDNELRLAKEIRGYDGEEKKAPVWAEADKAHRVSIEVAKLRANYLGRLQGALAIDPTCPRAGALVFEHYQRDHLAAEQGGDEPEAARYEALLRQQDQARAEIYMTGTVPVTLHTSPSGARVSVQRYTQRARRLQLDEPSLLGTSPLEGVPLAPGSYLLTIEHPSCEAVRYPLKVERGTPWAAYPPGRHDQHHPVYLPPAGSLAEDDCYVPAGWSFVGGDALAVDGLPYGRVWIDGFAIKRSPVTHRAYADFIRSLIKRNEQELATRYLPHEGDAFVRSAERARPVREDDLPDRFVLQADADDHYRPELPVILISYEAAQAYCAWRSERDGFAWRLVHGLEREKAARGVDGRTFPWGNHFDPAFTWVLESQGEHAFRTDVSEVRRDISPYGVTGLSGNVLDLCLNEWRLGGPPLHDGRLDVGQAALPQRAGDRVTVRGGSWVSVGATVRAASRFAMLRSHVRRNTGFRIARSIEP